MIMNANDLFKAVMQLDLEPIKTKLMHVESGEGWSLEKANAVEKEYRRYLCLMKLYPEEDTAPLVDVDTFWHYHILDTMKYAADCERVFGYFLHHYPHIGLSGSEKEDLARFESGDRLRELYEATFGEAYPGWPTVAAETPAWGAGSADGSVHARAVGTANGIAFSAGPGGDRLRTHARDMASAIAFSAGPGGDRLRTSARGMASAIAFSAGPGGDRLRTHARNMASAIAFSAGPGGDKLRTSARGPIKTPEFRSVPAARALTAQVLPTTN
jgi:hypothetical protein